MGPVVGLRRREVGQRVREARSYGREQRQWLLMGDGRMWWLDFGEPLLSASSFLNGCKHRPAVGILTSLCLHSGLGGVGGMHLVWEGPKGPYLRSFLHIAPVWSFRWGLVIKDGLGNMLSLATMGS